MMKYTWIAQGGEELSTSRYRAFNRYRQMLAHEFNTCVWIGLEPGRWWVQDPPRELWDDIPGSTAIVQRIPYTDQNASLFMKVKRQARRVGFDIDDFLFNNTVLPPNCNLTIQECEGYQKAIEWADFVVCSTPELQNEIKHRWPDKEVRVSENVLCPLLTEVAQQRVVERRSRRVKIGYSSGTSMHQQDFEMVRPLLDRLLDKYPHVDLTIIGTLPLPREFEQKWISQGKLRRWPFVTYDALPFVIGGLFDINLVPLADTRFNRCKSLVKFMEAAVFEVPTVCSRIGRFQALPEGTAFSAQGPEEWEYHLTRLIGNRELRMEIGRSAREHVLKRYTYKCFTGLEDWEP